MIKKIIFVLTAAVAILFASCDKYDQDIRDIEDRLDKIEGTSLTTIDRQITAINGSIDDLKVVDAELKGYIESLQNTAADLQSQIDATNTEIENVKKEMGDEIDAVEQSLLNKLDNLKATLEGELATIKANIETLKAKDTELEGRIAALETYVDTQLQGTKDWANATFATLAQYEEIQGTIAGIKGDIAAINTAIANLETRINEKIATDIKAAIDALRAELGADYAAKIEAATEAVTSAYTAAIATAKDDIEAAYTKAIADAIAASEAAMKEWVNGELQKVYSDISALRIELEALAASAATDEELAAAVTAQQAALEQAKKDLTAAYEAAIKKAIEDNNGKISAEIAAAVKTAQDNLQVQIDAINSEIEKIKARLDIIEADINSIKQQIDDLKGVDAELKGYIESLQNTANDLQSKIDATNDALAVLESDLEGRITASEQKVLDELKTVKTALEGQLATIKETITTLTSRLTIIEGKIVQLFNAIDECATQEDVNEVKQNLATVQSDMAAMKVAIKDLQDRMDTVEGEVDSLQTAVDNLESRIEALEKNFANRIQSLVFVPQYSDGKILMDYTGRTTQAHFRISPATIAKLIEVKNVKAFARYTNDPTTRAYEPEFPLVVVSVTGDETGMLEVNLKEDSENLFDTDFWAGKKEAVIYIQITDENGNNVVSDAIPMMAHGYGSNEGNQVYGFGDGNTYTGEITE